MAPREFSILKAKPAGREGGGGGERTNLPRTAWTPKCGSVWSHSFILALQSLLQAKSEKDLSDMQSDGVESTYWAGTESGLMDIYNILGVIYATDG